MDADIMQSAIAAFGASWRARMAAEVVKRMSGQPSRVIYAQENAHETMWQEYCHAHSGGETHNALTLWAALIEPYAESLVAALPEPEVRLVAIAARRHADGGRDGPEERGVAVRYVLEEVAAFARKAALDASASTGYTPMLWRVAPDGDDAEVLHSLMEAVRDIVRRAWCRGQDLIAAGEALDALERIEEGEPIEVNVEVTAGFEEGDQSFREGRFLSLRVCEDYVSLDQTLTTDSPEEGGDHHSDPLVRLYPRGRFPRDNVEAWLRDLDTVLQAERIRITVARDHV